MGVMGVMGSSRVRETYIYIYIDKRILVYAHDIYPSHPSRTRLHKDFLSIYPSQHPSQHPSHPSRTPLHIDQPIIFIGQ